MITTRGEKHVIWAWLVKEADGREGIIATGVPGVAAITALVASNEQIARHLYAPFAKAHGAASGRPVRLARFVEEPFDL